MKTHTQTIRRRAAQPRRAARCLLALGMMAAAGNVWAACTSTVPGNGPLQAAMSGVAVRFPSNSPVGTVFHSGSIGNFSSTNAGEITCNPSSGDMAMEGALGVYNPTHRAYAIGESGVGIRFDYNFDSLPVTYNYSFNASWRAGQNIYIGNMGYALVKIKDEMGPEVSITGSIFQFRVPAQGYFIHTVVSLSSPIVIVPDSPTCQVTTPNITLDIGTVDGTALKDSGESPLSPAQSIQLNCSGGEPGASIGVYIVMTDASNAANTSDRLPAHNEDGNPIPGLDVQLLRRNGTPIAFGPDSAADDAPGQWKAGSTLNNPAYQIPIRARYVYSGTADIPGGTAGAAATFTMNYH